MELGRNELERELAAVQEYCNRLLACSETSIDVPAVKELKSQVDSFNGDRGEWDHVKIVILV